MTDSNAWKVAREAIADAVSDMEFWRTKSAEEFSKTAHSRIRSLPEPPAFRAAVEAEMGEVVEMLRAEVARLKDDHKYADLHVEALAEIKATIDGKSDQSVAAIIEGLLEEINARALLSRIEEGMR